MADPIPWYLIDTPQPNLFSIGLVCPMKQVQSDPANWPSQGDILSSNVFNSNRAMATPDQYGNFQFVDKKCDLKSSNVTFIYGKNKTEEEKKTPFRTSWKKHGNHRWPPILKGIVILSDNNLPRSSNIIFNGQSGVATGPVYYDRYVYVPDCNEGTRFLLEEFFAATKFVIPRYRTPVATSVQFSVPGLNGSFPEALHDDIDIPPARTSNAMFLGGVALTGNGQVEGQFFPKTNFKTWLPYVLLDEQEQQDGGWYRQRIRVYPPLLPKAIRRG